MIKLESDRILLLCSLGRDNSHIIDDASCPYRTHTCLLSVCIPENVDQGLGLGAFFAGCGTLMNNLTIDPHMSTIGKELPILSKHPLGEWQQLVHQ